MANGNGMKIHGRLQKNAEAITSTVEDLHAHLTECENTIGVLSTELKDAQKIIAQRERELNQAEGNINSLRGDLSLVNERAKRFEDGLNTLRDSTTATISELKTELADAVAFSRGRE